MLNILLIEDNDNIRENTSEILTLSGYRVFSANNGRQGLIVAGECQPDLIICDIMMPGMNGFEVFHAIKSLNTLKEVPFIFLTAKSEQSELKKGMDMGAAGYVIKPYDEEHLLAAISKNINKLKGEGQRHTDPMAHSNRILKSPM